MQLNKAFVTVSVLFPEELIAFLVIEDLLAVAYLTDGPMPGIQ